MSKSVYVSKEQNYEPALDYDYLKKQGIAYIQQLAGDNWTDFNAHDPGVTILEQLAYAITELGYRSKLDFLDILASQKNDDTKDTFFTAAKILPTNPLTINDYRKIIIDRVEGVNNLWIIPLNNFTTRKNIKGLYITLLEIDPYTALDAEEIKFQTKKHLNYYSNLGETFVDVIILKKQEVYLKCQIDLEKDAQVEKVHAEVLYQLKYLFTRPLVYKSMNQLLEEGHEIDEIFEGPVMLRNGFLDDECLNEKENVFHNSHLLNKLRNIDGIKKIKYLNLVLESTDEQGNTVYKNYYNQLAQKEISELVLIKWDTVAVLGSKLFQDVNDHRFFTYYKEEIPVSVFQKEVDRNLNNMEAKVKIGYGQKVAIKKDIRNDFPDDFPKESLNDIPLPQGKRMALGNYSSIQHQFPEIYGLSQKGLSSNTTAERKVQVYQLKAYLLFFEQVLANYLEQLTRFTELYALDKEVEQSYFVQLPWDIPKLKELVAAVDPTLERIHFEKEVQRVVEEIMSGIDNFYERRKKFIHHLLARFGEDTFLFSFEKFNYYQSDEDFKKSLLDNALTLLQNYFWISAKKARSFDHSSPFWQDDLAQGNKLHTNLSVLEHKIRFMIGLTDEVHKIATNLKEKVNFGNKDTLENIQKRLQHTLVQRIRYMAESAKGLWEKEHLSKENDLKLIEDISIDESLFKRGIWDENLKVVSYKDDHKHAVLYKMKDADFIVEYFQQVIQDRGERILFTEVKDHHRIEISFEMKGYQPYYFEFVREDTGHFSMNPTQVWEVLAMYDSEEEAFRAAYSLKNNLIRWNKESEGFFVIDHVLLRPRNEVAKVNILLNDPTTDWSFHLVELFNFSEIEEKIRENVAYMRKLDYHIYRKGKRFGIEWNEKDGRKIGWCSQKYDTIAKAKDKAEEIKRYFINFTDFEAYDPNRVKFNYEVQEQKHPLHHYSFTLTVFLSAWTARFSDLEFRYQLEALFRMNTPAHIALNFQWLEHKEMLYFEEIYTQWLVENRKKETDYDALNQLSDQLLTLAKI